MKTPRAAASQRAVARRLLAFLDPRQSVGAAGAADVFARRATTAAENPSVLRSPPAPTDVPLAPLATPRKVTRCVTRWPNAVIHESVLAANQVRDVRAAFRPRESIERNPAIRERTLPNGNAARRQVAPWGKPHRNRSSMSYAPSEGSRVSRASLAEDSDSEVTAIVAFRCFARVRASDSTISRSDPMVRRSVSCCSSLRLLSRY